jgi:hypothetical protein
MQLKKEIRGWSLPIIYKSLFGYVQRICFWGKNTGDLLSEVLRFPFSLLDSAVRHAMCLHIPAGYNPDPEVSAEQKRGVSSTRHPHGSPITLMDGNVSFAFPGFDPPGFFVLDPDQGKYRPILGIFPLDFSRPL